MVDILMLKTEKKSQTKIAITNGDSRFFYDESPYTLYQTRCR